LKFAVHNTNLKEVIFEIFELSNNKNELFFIKIKNDSTDHEILKFIKLEAAWILINLLTCDSDEMKILINGNYKLKSQMIVQFNSQNGITFY
jgi:hypothetical protein